MSRTGNGEAVTLAACLSPDPRALGSRAAAFDAWLAERTAGWEAAGFRPPTGSAPPAAGDESGPVHLARAASPEAFGAAGEWIAAASFSDEDRRAARRLLTDCLAVGAAPSWPGFLRGGEARAILRAFPPAGPPPVSLWRPEGTTARAGLGAAIVWNRVRGDASELHVGPECAAAAVAAAECLGAAMNDLLDAIAVSCGIAAWHRDLLGRTLEERGIHPPGALAAVAAAAAVARLAGLGPDAAAACLRRADALTPLHPYAAFDQGTGAKLLYGAWGQFLGAAAALEERFPGKAAPGLPFPPENGAPGPTDPGRGPFSRQAAGAAVHQVSFKKYPGSRALQPMLAALESLLPAAPEEIRRIGIESYPYSAALSRRADPARGPIAAQMHLPTAAALLIRVHHQGRPCEPSLYGEARHPRVRRLARRCRVRARRFGPTGGGPPVRVRRARVTLVLRNGARRAAEAGNPFAPPPAGAIRRRFAAFSRGAGLADPADLDGRAPVHALFRGRSGASRPAAA